MRPLQLCSLKYKRLVMATCLLCVIQITAIIRTVSFVEDSTLVETLHELEEESSTSSLRGAKSERVDSIFRTQRDTHVPALSGPTWLSLGVDGPSEDEHIYRWLVSKGVTTGGVFRELAPYKQDELARELGVDKYVAYRAVNRFRQYVGKYHVHTYPILVHPGACDSKLTSLLVAHTRPNSFSERAQIREHLGDSTFSIGSRLLFLIGRPHRDDYQDVKQETAMFGDVIMADFEEDYGNLTVKTLIMLEWTTMNCPMARTLLKFDDDVFINRVRLIQFLKNFSNEKRALMGLVSNNITVIRNVNSKYYMPRYMYGPSNYPPFAHGGAYALSTDVIGDVLDVAKRSTYIHLEDVFLGVCFSFIKDARVISVPRFLGYRCSTNDSVAYHMVKC